MIFVDTSIWIDHLNNSNDEEVYTLLENKKLYGLGLGFVDVHFLESALIYNFKIWTRDKTLKKVAKRLNIHN